MAVTNYIWDDESDSYLQETDGTGASTATYTVEPDQYGKVISERRGSTTHWHHYDGLGSTRELTDSAGTVTDTFLYDAWGHEVARTGTTATPFRWVGELGYYYDVETTDFYVRARIYRPAIARWLSLDPVGIIDAVMKYKYAINNPRTFIDPNGLASTYIMGGFMGVVSCSGSCCDEHCWWDALFFTQRNRKEEEFNAIWDATYRACECANKALEAIRRFWRQILDEWPNSRMAMGTLQNNRDFYERVLKRAVDACTGGEIKFDCEDPSGNCGNPEVAMYVNVWFNWRLNSNIHVCDNFFLQKQPGARGLTVIHEFGRYFGSIEDDLTGINSIQIWDSILANLCTYYDYLAEKAKERERDEPRPPWFSHPPTPHRERIDPHPTRYP